MGINYIAAGVFTYLVLAGYSWGQASPSETDSERIRKLEEAVQQLRQENTELKQKMDQLNEHKPVVVPETAMTGSPSTPSPANKWASFVIPGGKETSLKLGGFIQGQGEFGDTGSFSGNFPDNPIGGAAHVPLHNRFRIRRARVNLTGDFYEKFDFKLEGDFANTDGISGNRTAFSGTDLFGNWHQFDEANLKIGQFKAPFGWEQTTSDTALWTIERSLVTGGVTPDRQIGVQLWGEPLAAFVPEHKDRLDYAVGMFNGNGRNISVNDDAFFMYVGRISGVPWSGKIFDQPAKLRLGGDVMTSRYGAGTRISPTDNLLLDPLDGSLSGFTTPGPAKSTGWAVNESFNIGPFDLLAEYLEQDIRPRHLTAFREFTANGYYVQGSYFLCDKKWQVISRWTTFNPGQAPDDDIKSILGGVNYYIKGDYIKVMLNYVHTWSDFRDAHRAAGNDQFDEVLLRMQLMF